MLLLDVNVILAAFREDHAQHPVVAPWLARLVADDAPFSVPDVVWVSFFRIATSRKALGTASPFPLLVEFAKWVRSSWGYIGVRAQYDDWASFEAVVTEADAQGDLVPDAYLAAIAREANCAIATFDRDFRRFTGIRIVEPSA